jgi:peroxisomal 2,4-dienoyl-CoA reductase
MSATKVRTGPLAAFEANLLAGHVVLVTGGGTGICRGIAQAFAECGADVCIVGRKGDVLAQTAAEMSAATGRDIFFVPCDVRQPDAVADAIAQTIAKFGHLDTVVNGAAGNFLAPAAALSANGFRTVVDIDLCGTFNVARAAFEALRLGGRGLIINISATLHYGGTPLQIHASAAKAGVDAVTRNLAVEWGQFGIRVNGIAPGPIAETEGMRRLAGSAADKAKASVPLGRFGAIEEIAAAAVFLRSSAAAYITGTTLVVDGGQSVVAAAAHMMMT